MSLALLCSSYSSDEEEAEQEEPEEESSTGEQRQEEAQELSEPTRKQQNALALPTAAAAFAEVTGPPDFLVHSVVVGSTAAAADKKDSKKTSLPDAVIQAKPQLVSAAARSTDEGSAASNGSPSRSLRPPNPPLEDAAALLRVCVPCGVPKVFSGDKMVCPQCKDRPQPAEAPDKRRAGASSKVKDKERSKRIKGQSSHASWKSETEMVLRQQFD